MPVPWTLQFLEIPGEYLQSGAYKIVGDFVHVVLPIWIPQALAQKYTFKTELLWKKTASFHRHTQCQQIADFKAQYRSGCAFCRENAKGEYFGKT